MSELNYIFGESVAVIDGTHVTADLDPDTSYPVGVENVSGSSFNWFTAPDALRLAAALLDAVNRSARGAGVPVTPIEVIEGAIDAAQDLAFTYRKPGEAPTYRVVTPLAIEDGERLIAHNDEGEYRTFRLDRIEGTPVIA